MTKRLASIDARKMETILLSRRSWLQAQLAGRLDERQRIARELHDTLLQSTYGLILRFKAISVQLPARDPMRIRMELALAQAGELLDEARAQVQHLRSGYPRENIIEAIKHAGTMLSHNTNIQFGLTAFGRQRPLSDCAAKEIYNITREAIANAIAHSSAKAVEVVVKFGINRLIVRISDDGKGFALPIGMDKRGQPHLGIQGMFERASNINAQITIRSRESGGAEVECKVPASFAYAATCSQLNERRALLSTHRPERNAVEKAMHLST